MYNFITIPMVIVTALWSWQLYVGYKAYNARTYITVGRKFLEYARQLFRQSEKPKHVQHMFEVRQELIGYRNDNTRRFLIIAGSQFFTFSLFLATLTEINMLPVNFLAAMSIAYSVAAFKEIMLDMRVVDRVCTDVDEELKHFGHMTAFEDLIYGK